MSKVRTAVPSGELEALMNLGPRTREWLNSIGVVSRADLVKAGTIEACRRMRERGWPVSVVAAYAIEGALLGQHWNSLPLDTRKHLHMQFRLSVTASKGRPQ